MIANFEREFKKAAPIFDDEILGFDLSKVLDFQAKTIKAEPKQNYNYTSKEDHDYYSERLASKTGVYNKTRRNRYSQKLERVTLQKLESKKRKEREVERVIADEPFNLDDITSDLNTG